MFKIMNANRGCAKINKQKKRNGLKLMIAINKEEKDAIVARFPEAHVVRTMKSKSKRHHYYCEETRQVSKFINNYRRSKQAES